MAQKIRVNWQQTADPEKKQASYRINYNIRRPSIEVYYYLGSLQVPKFMIMLDLDQVHWNLDLIKSPKYTKVIGTSRILNTSTCDL